MVLIRTAVLGTALLVAAPLAAQTQTYRCTAKDGKKYYSSTIPRQCIGRPVEVLNAQGTVIKRIDSQADEKSRQEKEAALAKKREQEAARREVDRRNRALLATYTSARDIEDARARALGDNQKSMRDVESRIETARKRRAGYQKELDFYKGKTPPQKLAEDAQAADVEIKANEALLAEKKQQVAHINARYDEDKKLYLELTRRR